MLEPHSLTQLTVVDLYVVPYRWLQVHAAFRAFHLSLRFVHFLTWVSRYPSTNLYDIVWMLKRTDDQTSAPCTAERFLMWGRGPYLCYKFLYGIYDDLGFAVPRKHVSRAWDET